MLEQRKKDLIVLLTRMKGLYTAHLLNRRIQVVTTQVKDFEANLVELYTSVFKMLSAFSWQHKDIQALEAFGDYLDVQWLEMCRFYEPSLDKFAGTRLSRTASMIPLHWEVEISGNVSANIPLGMAK